MAVRSRPRDPNIFEEVKNLPKVHGQCPICGRRYNLENQVDCPWCSFYEKHEHVAPEKGTIPKWIKEDLLKHKGFTKLENGTYKRQTVAEENHESK